MGKLNREDFLGKVAQKKKRAVAKRRRVSEGGPSAPGAPVQAEDIPAPAPVSTVAPGIGIEVIEIDPSRSAEEIPAPQAEVPMPAAEHAQDDVAWLEETTAEGPPAEVPATEVPSVGEESVRASEVRPDRAAGPSKKRKRKKEKAHRPEEPLVTVSGAPLRSGGSAPEPTDIGRGEKERFWSDPGPDRSPAVGDRILVRGRPRAFGLRDASTARQLIRAIQVPRDRAVMNALSLGELLDRAMLDALRHVHSAAHLHDNILSQAKLLKKNKAIRRELEDQVRVAREMLREVREQHDGCPKREETMRSELERARQTEFEVNKRSAELMDAAEKLKDQNKELRVRVAADEERISEMLQAATSAESRLSSQAEEFGAQLAEMKELLGKKEEETARLRSDFECLQSEAPEKAKMDYLASAAYKEELVECASDAYIKGYEDCLLKIREADPGFDSSKFELGAPGDGEEEEESEEEEDRNEK